MAAARSDRAVYSFAAASAALPPEVIEEARDALRSWGQSGLSVASLPFTDPDFGRIHDDAESALRDLLSLPSDYHVLFLQGGASAHFSLVPLNLVGADEEAAYLVAGLWSARAAKEAGRVCRARTLPARGSGPDRLGLSPPVLDISDLRGCTYCHVTTNETADGIRLPDLPDVGIPLIADMTGNFLTERLAVSRYALIYASAQKNLGTAGLTLVIVRDDLLRRRRQQVPPPFDYTLQAAERSRVNTPPVMALYLAGLMLKWLKRQGGLAAAEVRARRRSGRIYDRIDSSDFYECPIPPALRSRVNVAFRLKTAALQRDFLAAARAAGLLHLEGHPAIGGLRASFYNGVPEEAVAKLATFMDEFAAGRQ